MNSPENQSPPRHGLVKFCSFACSILLIALVVGTVATFFANRYWIAEIFCHLRVQMTAALIACLVITFLLKQRRRMIAASLSLAINAIWLFPYLVPGSTEPALINVANGETATPIASIKIMSANVLTSNRQFASFLETVRNHDPDVLIVMEINPRWEQEIVDGLGDDYPHRKIMSMEQGNFGIGLLSKLPLIRIEPIIAEDTDLISLDARIESPTGRPLRLIATHPFPPLSQPCFQSRTEQLLRIANRFDPNEDNVMAGDFNLTPWSPVFTEVLAAGDLKDSRTGMGTASTWHAFPTFIGGLQIDHVLTSESLNILDHQISDDYGSDHLAVIVEIQQTRAATMTNPKPAPPEADGQASRSEETRPTAALVYSPKYLINLGGMERMHPFDIRKYEKIHDALIKDGIVSTNDFRVPKELTTEDLRLIHTADYLDRLKSRNNIANYLEADLLRLYPGSLDKAVLRPFRRASGGTLLAARESLNSGIGINLGGGYHHAKPNIGEGFCLYADVPIAIRKLQQEGLIKKALVIDVDVHQGNGTAECLADDNSTYTFSMHQGDIYPIPKATSDRDVELKAGDGDEEFLAVLNEHLDEIIKLADADICFIVGGCDPLDGDPLANLTMTPQGIAKRDAMIVQRCAENNLPVVLTLSGGYSKDAWESQYLSIKGLIETWGVAK